MPPLHVVVVPHTHWDREWYRPYQEFRLALVGVLDELLTALSAGTPLAPAMLDGQTILLDDYLELRPERQDELRHHVQVGRLLIGPWYVQPDEFLVSGEALIRNLLRGGRDAARFGPPMPVGYLADQFGHIAQMPQILRGFGMATAAFWRGRARDAGQSEVWWQAPDGSRVLALHLSDSYGNASPLPLDPPLLARRIRELCAALDGVATSPARLLMNGMDHRPFQVGLPAALQAAAPLLSPDYLVEIGSLTDYAQSIQSEHLAVEQGEYRNPKSTPLLPGVLSTRLDLKMRNSGLQTLLEQQVEPWAALASLLPAPNDTPPALPYRYPRAEIELAWAYLLRNHAHDSICGCSIDSVAREMHTRFDWTAQITARVAATALLSLAGAIDTRPPWNQSGQDGAAIRPVQEWSHQGESMDRAGTWRPATAAMPEQLALITFNPSDSDRTDRTRLSLTLPGSGDEYEVVDEHGSLVPHRWLGQHGEPSTTMEAPAADIPDAESVLAQIPGDRIMDLGVHDLRVGIDGDAVVGHLTLGEQSVLTRAEIEEGVRYAGRLLRQDGYLRAVLHIHRSTRLELELLARDVPAHGYRTAWLRRATNQPSPPAGAPVPPPPPGDPPPVGPLSVDPFSVAVDPADGTLTIRDRRSGVSYTGCLAFEDGGDAGDTYTYAPPARDTLVAEPAEPPAITVDDDPLGATLRIAINLRVPAALTSSHTRRAPQVVTLPIVSAVTLTHGVPRVDITTHVDNTARDHRLRVSFTAPFATDHVHAEGAFEITRRSLPPTTPDDTADWAEQPAPTGPQQGFLAIHGPRPDGEGVPSALLITNHGLPEYEVRPAESNTTEVLLTLLRCTGDLSRDDLSTRKGHAGPGLPTPDAQCPGPQVASYALLPHSGHWHQAIAQARAFASPLTTVAVPCSPGRQITSPPALASPPPPPSTSNPPSLPESARSSPSLPGSAGILPASSSPEGANIRGPLWGPSSGLPPTGSFLRVWPPQVAVTALKGADDGRGIILRLCNLDHQPVHTYIMLAPCGGLQSAIRTNLAELSEEPATVTHQPDGALRIDVDLKAAEIVSFRLH